MTHEPGARLSRRVPIIIGCALFMQTLDSTIIVNALPTMAREMGETPLALNTAITSYFLAAAIFLPVSGWLADRFGARTIFLWAIAVFTLSSAFCGLSQNLPQLVAARLLQGASGAMLMPVGRLVLLKTTPRAQLVGALAVLTMPSMLGPVLGPVLGGFLVTFVDWRAIFFINLPIGFAGYLLVRAYVPNVREEIRRPFDALGFALTGLGLAGLIYGFENLGRGAMPLWAPPALLLGGAAFMAMFALHARRTPHAILDLDILKSRTFVASLGGGAFNRLLIGAMPFLLALLLQIGFGLSAFAAGALTFVGAAGAFLMKIAAPPILRRFGFRTVLIANALVCAAFMAAAAIFRPDTPHWVILAILFVGGFFRSLQFTALNALAFAEIAPAQMSGASSLSSMGQQLALSIGAGLAALLVELLQRAMGADTLTYAIVSPAFLIVAALSLISLAFFIPLRRDAGADLSGARPAHPRAVED